MQHCLVWLSEKESRGFAILVFLSAVYSLFFIFLQITKSLAAITAIQWWVGPVALVA